LKSTRIKNKVNTKIEFLNLYLTNELLILGLIFDLLGGARKGEEDVNVEFTGSKQNDFGS